MNISIDYPSQVILDVAPCQEISVCLDPAVWAARTVSGIAVVKATIENAGRTLGRASMRHSSWNARGADLFQYAFTIDDAQFIENPATPGTPYQPTCEDIVDVIPHGCIADALEALQAQIIIE